MFDKQFGQEGHSLKHCSLSSDLDSDSTWNAFNNKHCSFFLSCRHFLKQIYELPEGRVLACSVFRYRHYCKIQIITKISCVHPRPHEYEYSGRYPLFLHQPLIYWSLVTLLNGSLNTNTFKNICPITFTFSLLCTKPPLFPSLKSSVDTAYIQPNMPRMGEKLDGHKKGNDH